jgi:hypothetical protein
MALAPAVGVIVYASARGSWSIFAVALMIGAGAFSLGGLLGFLFGIPRTLTAQAQPASASGNQGPAHAPNTNLEQISDWLTKILVGIGLVQFGQLINSINDLADTLVPALGNDETAKSFAIGLLVAFFIGGFMVGYVFTRLRLQRAIVLADLALSPKDVKELAVSALEQQGKADADALTLTNRQLDPGEANPTQEELDKAIAAASPGMKKQVFDLARRQRKKNRESDTERMERTIPVFRALTGADRDQRFHRHFAELGYALKDSPTPDYKGAEAALSKAIEIRDRQKEVGFPIYELNRALCRIALDPTDNTNSPSDAGTRQSILADLKRAASTSDPAGLIKGHPTIQAWLGRNGLSTEDVLAPRRPAGEPGTNGPE